MRAGKNGIASQPPRGADLLALLCFVVFGAGMALYWAARMALFGQS